jgi:hypothetical protein
VEVEFIKEVHQYEHRRGERKREEISRLESQGSIDGIYITVNKILFDA